MENEKNLKRDSKPRKNNKKKNFESKQQDNASHKKQDKNHKKGNSNQKHKQKNDHSSSNKNNKQNETNNNNKQFKNNKPQKEQRRNNNKQRQEEYFNEDEELLLATEEYYNEEQSQQVREEPQQKHVDDHPRAVVLCFDQKAIEDIKPRKYTSGYEIYRIPISLARNLYQDHFLEQMTKLTGMEFTDKKFLLLRKDDLREVKEYCYDKRKNRKTDKDLKNFYGHLEYFITYLEKYDTAVAFDL